MKNMKSSSFITLITGLLLGALSAQAGHDGWLTNFEEAKAQAKAEGKNILVEFHGSDWCPPCIKLNEEILSHEAFKVLAGKALVLVDADFPRKSKLSPEQKEHNDKLASQFGVRYFPTILILTSKGEVLDKSVGFPEGGLEEFLRFITAK